MPSPTKAFLSSGIPGLDAILGGGLRPGHVYFVEGESGSGKTTLGLQFLIEGARHQERCLLVSLAESPEEIQLVASSHGWQLDGIALRDLASADSVRSSALFHLSEIDLDDRVQALMQEMDKLQPQRLMLDTLSALRALCDQPRTFRRIVEQFRSKTQSLGCTLLIADDAYGEAALHPRSLAWGIIRLEQWLGDYGPAHRRLSVPKLRGQTFAGGYHDFRIGVGGLEVFPRLTKPDAPASQEHPKASSGLPELDALLGGGLERGTSVGLIGPPGCGKSTLASIFALAAAARGERVALYLFDESIETFRRRAESQGLDVLQPEQQGLLSLRKIDPAELSPGELSRAMADEAETKQSRLIIIDSLNGYIQAMPDERFMSVHIHALLGYLGSLGAITLVTLAQQAPFVCREGQAVDLSYLTDTVVAQRYFEAFGVIRYALSVLKKRYGDHERSIREYRFGPGGISVGEPLTEFRGVLGGQPDYVGDKKPLL
ncbi:MAG: AAA family ATPase [Thiohalocapsa sp.]|nr:AAA family ATPase [Thiohalocapsa sp.]MCF7993177.1 AAA family ATPase [Thiohalocapsa sp.]